MSESSDKPQQCYPSRGEAHSSIRCNARSCVIMVIILFVVLVLLGLAAQYWSRRCQVPESEQLREKLSEIEPIDHAGPGSLSSRGKVMRHEQRCCSEVMASMAARVGSQRVHSSGASVSYNDRADRAHRRVGVL
jgi:hypothetical protein